ncbi:MAG: hypothetical protein MI892_11725 [Desulfobacterales bacterium]|nr:hypothetical protein [Desulfobacterales bacterium]
MNKEAHIDNIRKRFQDYEDLQESHLNLLRTEQLPDLSKMTMERKIASDELQKALNGFMENAGLLHGGSSLNVLNRFENRLGTLLKVDDSIAVEIEKHRDELKKSLNRLKHGNKAMQGYRPADTHRNKPRVLSINR